MTLRTGNRERSAGERKNGRGAWTAPAAFTLIELILVMSMLLVVLAVSAPTLGRFFRGRTLDSEAKRFLALTRYGQSRAVSEGMPMLLWIDEKQGAYGLRVESSYSNEDTNAVEFRVDKDVTVETQQSLVSQRQAAVWRGGGDLSPLLPKIRFTPDGFIGESSPELVIFRQGTDGEIWIGQSTNRLSYEIQTNQLPRLR